MTSFVIAAAGTGGHIYPGLAVAEQLEAAGVERRRIVFMGGARMEADIIPQAGYPFVQLEIQGLVRGLSSRNLRLPKTVWRAARRAGREMEERRTAAALCMGGYVTVPVAAAARRRKIPLYLHEQNAEAGLANRLAGRWADRSFVSFPDTRGLAAGEAVGYPLRASLAGLDKAAARPEALERYGFSPHLPTVGAVGGSLGAEDLNRAVTRAAAEWEGPPVQIIHLTGAAREGRVSTAADAPGVTRKAAGFEERMDLFYAASDLVVARAGGGLMEAAAAGAPAVLAPGSFAGSHQLANAEALAAAGAAVILRRGGLESLGAVLSGLLADEPRREQMARAAVRFSRPDAAAAVAAAMLERRHVRSG